MPTTKTAKPVAATLDVKADFIKATRNHFVYQIVGEEPATATALGKVYANRTEFEGDPPFSAVLTISIRPA